MLQIEEKCIPFLGTGSPSTVFNQWKCGGIARWRGNFINKCSTQLLLLAETSTQNNLAIWPLDVGACQMQIGEIHSLVVLHLLNCLQARRRGNSVIHRSMYELVWNRHERKLNFCPVCTYNVCEEWGGCFSSRCLLLSMSQKKLYIIDHDDGDGEKNVTV